MSMTHAIKTDGKSPGSSLFSLHALKNVYFLDNTNVPEFVTLGRLNRSTSGRAVLLIHHTSIPSFYAQTVPSSGDSKRCTERSRFQAEEIVSGGEKQFLILDIRPAQSVSQPANARLPPGAPRPIPADHYRFGVSTSAAEWSPRKSRPATIRHFPSEYATNSVPAQSRRGDRPFVEKTR